VYEYVFRYTQRSIWDAFCSCTLYPGRTVLLNELLAYSNVIDETRRDELAEYPKLSKVRGGMGGQVMLYLLLLLLYLNVPWRRQFWGEAGVGVGVGEIGADNVADLRS
jgi:hypothetical protein